MRDRRNWTSITVIGIIAVLLSGIIANAANSGTSKPLEKEHYFTEVNDKSLFWGVSIGDRYNFSIMEYHYVKPLNQDVYYAEITELPSLDDVSSLYYMPGAEYDNYKFDGSIASITKYSPNLVMPIGNWSYLSYLVTSYSGIGTYVLFESPTEWGFSLELEYSVTNYRSVRYDRNTGVQLQFNFTTDNPEREGVELTFNRRRGVEPPIILGPLDVHIYTDDSSNELVWNVLKDDLVSYAISRNGRIIEANSWTIGDTSVSINVNNLPRGQYIYEFIVTDQSGLTSSDEVEVTVFRDSSESTSLITTPTPLPTTRTKDIPQWFSFILDENTSLLLMWGSFVVIAVFGSLLFRHWLKDN
ncbi:MAG: hypothetical protein RTU30_09030 [Candidatus Thorarchaeota archaeon]